MDTKFVNAVLQNPHLRKRNANILANVFKLLQFVALKNA